MKIWHSWSFEVNWPQCWNTMLGSTPVSQEQKFEAHRLTQSEQLKTVAWSDEAWFLLRLADGGLRMISWTQPGLLPVQAGGSDGDCEMFCGIFWTFYKQNFVPSNGYFVQNMFPYHKAKSVFQWKLLCIYPCRSKVLLIKWSLGMYQLFSVCFILKRQGLGGLF